MDAELLQQELAPRLTTHLSAINNVKAIEVISFDQLWLILVPGRLMISQRYGTTCVSMLREIRYVQGRFEPDYWVLVLGQVEWNGSDYGYSFYKEKISEYHEPRQVRKLDVYPLEFCTAQEEICEQLVARGKKFASLRGFHMMVCNGKKYVQAEEQPVSGRVIIDAYAYWLCQNKPTPDLVRTFLDKPANFSDHGSEDVEPEDYNDKPSVGKQQPSKEGRCEDLSDLSPTECMLATPRVKGFDLNTKQWCEFNVDDLREPVWNLKPYDNLVLPEGEKELVMAFADHPRSRMQGFDDFVQQKGKGTTILLCGPPGVGKTLTAEAVAEKSKVPLYILSASDLGTKPEKVDTELVRAFQCCHLWDAVLLLDEADVFLETRGFSSLEHNELVSIFLRRLEYYQGLMFLTTNRLNVIDPAFKSRIDLILPYLDLDEASRRKVYVNFVDSLAPGISALDEKDFDELAKSEFNGREIKNLIKTALILATRENPPRLEMRHLQIVINIRQRAKEYEQRDSQQLGKRRRQSYNE